MILTAIFYYLPEMELPEVIRGMCRFAELDLESVPVFRFRKGTGNQDIYVEMRSQTKKIRAYYDAEKGVINEVDIREAHERTDSSRLLDVANQMAKEQASMDAFRLGLTER